MDVHRIRLGDGHLTTVRDEGTGEPCVLLHGSPLDRHSWDALIPYLARDARVIAYDLRGHGTAAGAPPAVSVADYADDLAALLDRLGVDRAHVVGHSFGGEVAQRFALAFPGRVRRLTLLCTRATPYPAFREAARLLADSGPAVRVSAVARWFPPEAVAADLPPVRYATACVRDADPAVWAATLRMIADFDALDGLRALPVPATAVAAEHDRVATPDAMRLIAEALPHGGFRLLAGAYHLAPLLLPQRTAAMIREDAAARPRAPEPRAPAGGHRRPGP
ncbi:alpha/beta fold hydrolase [Streptomyces sp. NPDC005805]|uniref:alpha/beta fold hydrolase n=1 Tax=Streptomyces sp. NPDC005805 TaxID=3157068 RepID=UPI0033E84E57